MVPSRVRKVPAGTASRPSATLGELVGIALAGAWREPSPQLALSPQQLARVTPRLLETGAAGLAWRRICQSRLASSPTGLQLQQAYRFQVLQAALQQNDLRQIVFFLRSAGIEPLIAKGWAAARLYPQAGLRPYGDIDIYVHPGHYPAALAALRSSGAPKCPVDLHEGFPELADDGWDRRNPVSSEKPDFWDDLYARSGSVKLCETEVRILGAEDQLRHLCLHFLRHGAWRPLWLCDIGAALESVPGGFDWDYCLRGDRRQGGAVVCAFGLANRLLGARIDEPRLARRTKRLPGWLVPAVLRQWGLPYRRYTGLPLAAQLQRPAGLVQALRQRWPNPIEATIGMGAAFDGVPRLPYQISDCLMRLARFISRPKGLKQESP